MRYSKWEGEEVDTPNIDQFLEAVLKVCKEYGFSISSGEYINSLEIVDYNEDENECLLAAVDGTMKVPK